MSQQTTSLSPEEFETRLRIVRIFMPLAGRKVDAAYPDRNVPAKFVHYTSAEAGLKIIQSKRLWMRNTTCMADFREVSHGFDLLLAAFKNKTKSRQFHDALDACVPGMAEKVLAFFDSHLPDIRANTFVTSVSTHFPREDRRGRLSMWRAFAPGAARVALVVNIPWFSGAAEALRLLFSPVEYLRSDEFEKEFSVVLANINDNTNFLRGVDPQLIFSFAYQMLLAGVTCLKHEAFDEEQEWRAVYGPHRFSSPLMERATEIIGGVPQTIYKIPLDGTKDAQLAGLELSHIFDHLIIGPTQFPGAIFEACVHELKEIGIHDADKRVWVSDIPIRS